MGVGPFRGHDLLYFFMLIKEYASLKGIEIDGTALLPFIAQRLVQGMQRVDVRHDAAELSAYAAVGFASLRNHGRNLRIGQARPRVHQGLVELESGDFPRRGNSHFANHTQAVHLRSQGTQTVGQLLRQHRHHFAGEINRVTAGVGLAIQRTAYGDIVSHIRNRHI